MEDNSLRIDSTKQYYFTRGSQCLSYNAGYKTFTETQILFDSVLEQIVLLSPMVGFDFWDGRKNLTDLKDLHCCLGQVL